MRRSIAVAASMLMCAWSGASSQQTPAPVFRSGLDLLTVEASVRDATGRPVTDLRPSDFIVSIDGEPRRVLNARLYGADDVRVARAGTPVPRFTRASDVDPGRLVVFAVDRDSIRSGSEKAILETASAMMSSFSPADAVGVIGLPLGGLDPTRDHAAAADALRLMTGTRPSVQWRFRLSWREALELYAANKEESQLLVERECSAFNSVFNPSDRDCSRELNVQAREMVAMGQGHAQTVLTRLGDLLDRLATVRAPKHLVLFSGGIAFDVQQLSRYRDLATKAAQARVSIFVIHLDQPAYDASDRMVETVFSGREFTTGLGNIASSTGGVFVEAVGTGAGVLSRMTSDINAFYQLGVESQPKDADVRTLRVKVEVTRQNLTIRAPSQIAVAPARRSPTTDAVTRALAEPLDVAEVPIEVATYMTHADEAGKVRLIVSATVPDAPGFVPAEWGYQVIDGGKVLGGSRDQIASPPTERWLGTASLVVPVGKYRIRTVVIASDGRIGRLDLPLDAALRASGAVRASDLIVGLPADGRVAPRARLTQGDPGVALLELSSTEPLTGTAGVVELTRAGTAQPAVRRPLELRAQSRNDTVLAGQALLDLSGLAPGTYMASAVLDRAGTPFARISRLVEVVPGGTSPPPTRSDSTTALPPVKTGTIRDLALDDVLQRVGRYVAGYGEQASLIVGVEHYEQRYQNAPAGERGDRKLLAEFALLKTDDTTGWVGFRDVIEVDGKPIPDRRDRLQSLLRSSTPDVSGARRIADEGARFNIGPTRRNFNEPTAALFFFMPVHHPRFAFTRKGMTSVNGVTAMEIDFHETGSPTLIRTTDGRDMVSDGTIWVIPADGTVLRTRLTVREFVGPASRAAVDVTFARDGRLKLWLPAKMTERHEASTDPAILARLPKRPPTVPAVGSTTPTTATHDDITSKAPSVVTATATYSDFKRFETGASFSVK